MDQHGPQISAEIMRLMKTILTMSKRTSINMMRKRTEYSRVGHINKKGLS